MAVGLSFIEDDDEGDPKAGWCFVDGPCVWQEVLRIFVFWLDDECCLI